MPWLASVRVFTRPCSIIWQKLGQPVPDSNLVAESKSGSWQTTQR